MGVVIYRFALIISTWNDWIIYKESYLQEMMSLDNIGLIIPTWNY